MKNLSVAVCIFIILISIVPVCFAYDEAGSEGMESELYKAKVLAIKDTITEEFQDGNITIITQLIDIRILDKELKGTVVEAKNTMQGNPAYDIKLKKGDIISVSVGYGEDGNKIFEVAGYERTHYVYQLIAIFLILLIIIGGWKGIKSIVSLGVTVALIIYVMIPLLLKGINPVLISIGVCAIATIITMTIIAGWNKKSLSAMMGTIGGITVGGGIAYIYGLLAKLTGLSSVDAQMLMYIPQGITFDFRGLLFAGILIGALGAAMDVSISIASALTELVEKDPDINFAQLMKHGMNIGKDIMGTMSNTLILAYTGGALSMILLFTAYARPLSEIINLDIVATEIIRSIAGSIGLLFAIPITAVSFAVLKDKNR